MNPDVRPLFVMEMANNHMGSLEHGLRIIREVHEACRGFEFVFGFKLQYRHLDTIIHPDYRTRTDVKYVKRFLETRLEPEELLALKHLMQDLGFVTVCTPFDELSVDLVEEHGYDYIKIASCSLTDWPLLERIARTDKPLIASTAANTLEDIDRAVSFFEHRGKELTLMHCVGRYPTPDNALGLNQIDLLANRYPQLRIGYSTHENPDNLDAIKIAVAKGATVFEKHVGVPTAEFPLNAYSATPEQVRRWLAAAREAFAMCGIRGRRPDFTDEELQTLHCLRRGAFAARRIQRGQRISPEDLFLALPASEGQVTANDLSKYSEFQATADIEPNSPLLWSNVSRKDTRAKVYAIVARVRKLLRKSGVAIPPKADLEISHHYGIDRFEEFGLTMLTVVNRSYCKKLIVLLPGQSHPEQYHNIKEETFHVLYGDVWVTLDGVTRQCKKGDLVVVERGARHAFGTASGAVLEEISSTHLIEDSYYTDPAIMDNSHRKTLLTYWLE